MPKPHRGACVKLCDCFVCLDEAEGSFDLVKLIDVLVLHQKSDAS